MRSRATSLVFLALGFTQSFAGTMGAVEAPADFGGLNLGLGTGYMTIFNYDQSSITHSDNLFNHSDSCRENNTAILFTGEVGYGKMFNQNTYFGAKGSIYYTPSQKRGETTHTDADSSNIDSVVDTDKTSLKPIYNVDLVLGYEIFPHVLPFVEGGVSFANVENTYEGNGIRVSAVHAGESQNFTQNLQLNGYKTGYNVGIGSNFLVKKNLFFSAELVYHDLGKNSGSLVIPADVLNSLSHTITHSQSNTAVSLIAGVSYLFPA